MPVDIKLSFKYKKNTYKMIMSDEDAKVKKLFPTVRKSFFILEILCLSYSSITMRCMKFMKSQHYNISLPSGILDIIVLLILIKNISEKVSDISSAIGNAHHTACSPPSLESMKAAGMSTTS